MTVGAGTAIERLEQELVDYAYRLAQGMAHWLDLVARFDALGGARRWGFRGTSEWLAWQCKLSDRSAREHVRVARRLVGLPLVREAFAAGELSYSQVRAITRADSGVDECRLLEFARSSTAVELERFIRALRSAPSADLEVANQAYERRFVAWDWQLDGSLRVYGQLPADDGAALIDVIDTAAACMTGEGAPPLGARRADALTEVMLSGAPRAHVVLHVDPASLGQVCAFEDGPSIPPDSARRLTCDAELLDDLGRRRRTVSPSLRAALERRDGRRCRFPGCVRRHNLQAHHIDHWAHGGKTDSDNLVFLCPFHHRLLHEEGFSMQRFGPGAFTYRRPDGRVIPHVPERAPPAMLVAAA